MRRYIFVNLVFVFLTLSAYAQITPTHIWTGSANTDWNDPHNWDTGSAPQLAPDGNSIVQIKALSSTPALYPVITTNNCHAKEIEIKSGASIDLQAQIILTQTSHSCAVKNSGLLKMHGTTAQKTWFEETSVAKKIVLESGSTVHYYDTSADALWAGPYENLIVERSIKSSTTLTVEKKLEVKCGTSDVEIIATTSLVANNKVEVSGAGSAKLTITSPSQTYNEEVFTSTCPLIFNANNDATFKKELKAIGQDISFTGGSLKTESAVTAKDINITFTNATWESQKAVTAHNINISGTGAKWESKEDITVTESITATSVDWKARTGNIKVQKHILADELHQSAGKLILNGSTPQNAKVKQIVELEVASGAIVNFNDSFILTGSLKNIGTLTIATLKWQASSDSMNIKNEGTLQITNLNCEPASSATIIAMEGQNDESKTKINNLSLVSAGGKNLLIRKKVTVEASLQLSGTNETSLLTVKGDGTDSKLHLPNQINDNGQYLEVHTNIPIVGHAYTTKKSNPKDVVDGDIALGKPENWIFEESLITLFTWATGAISSSWDESRNWIPRGTPYENHEVLIPAGASFYPVLSVNNKHAKVVTIKSHAVLDLASHIIEATSSNTAQIILEGTLKMEGTSVQKAWFENANEDNKIIIKIREY